jgi:predicted amino acid dehydrogenase
MLSIIWRILLVVCDYRAMWRFVTRRPCADVVIITNVRDDEERKRFFGPRNPESGHISGPRFYLDGVSARVRGINSSAAEILTVEGRRLAQAQFISACEWAEKQGAKVVLLAASTKRLFGRDGAVLKERFPNLLFTIGDNGTAQMLWADTERALKTAQLDRRLAKILVVGPYGILGSFMTRQLLKAGYQVTGYGPNEAALADIAAELDFPVTTRMDDIGKTDAVIACTHSTAAKLGIASVAHLRRRQRKLLVVDVSEPANLDRRVYKICRNEVIRQDAGNAYSPRLVHVLGPITWNMLMLSRGVVFGCFAESIALFHAIHVRGKTDLAQEDWFTVDPLHIDMVGEAFRAVGFEPPAPRCFGKSVDSFDLDYTPPAPIIDNRIATSVPSTAGGR